MLKFKKLLVLVVVVAGALLAPLAVGEAVALALLAARVAFASSMATYTFRAFLALTDVGLCHPAMTPAVPVLRAILLRASLVRDY